MGSVVVALAASDCERLRSGFLAQPANALSSLAYVAVGVWLLWESREPGRARFAPVASGIGLIGAGVGSFAYHGPQPAWSHLVHDSAVAGLVVVVSGQSIWLLVRRATRPAAVRGWKRAAPWIVPAVASYLLGRSGSPLCRPDGTWQFHAAWHVLSAAGLGRLVSGYGSRRSIGQIPEPRR
jgi:hypothetical protein